jgi:NADPH:quinone reductase-like Zn-dependent oxidoreductase
MGFMMSKIDRADLLLLRDLMQTGKVTPVIDKTYPLDQARDAGRLSRDGPGARQSGSHCERSTERRSAIGNAPAKSAITMFGCALAPRSSVPSPAGWST